MRTTRARRRPEPLYLTLAALVIAACVWPMPERQLLLDFFQACRVYDTTVLARLATVPCNPRTDGVVQRFDVVDVKRDTDARTVIIRASVRSFEGETSERIVEVAIGRREGRWMVTGLTPLQASQTSPAASSAPPR